LSSPEDHEKDGADGVGVYYSLRAGEYDQIYAKAERQTDLRAMERWLPPLLAGCEVLEVACGTGYWTQFLAPVAQRVVAIDAAAEPLAIARQRIQDERVTFLQGDAFRIPGNLGRFDAGFAGFWLSHVRRSRQREFLLQVSEHLEPGSRVVLLDNLYVAGSSTPICERDREGDTYQLRTLKDGSVHRVLKNFPTEGELRALLAGISDDWQFVQWQYYWGLGYLTQ
jgi:ubiquinone/menaquinone biosynthesis C-methylase UbiE